MNNINQAASTSSLKPLNQLANVSNQMVSTLNNNMINENKTEIFDESNTLKSGYQLGLVNNNNMPNINKNENKVLSDKAYSILYTQYNTLADASKFIYVEDPINVIGDCDNAIINQPPTYLQMASGCITENEYDVILDSPQGLIYSFYFKEKSSCCCRNCCKQDKRPFDMYGNHVASGKEIEHRKDNHYFRIERCCGFNHYCCFCNCVRPKMFVYYAKTDQFLGKIVDACSCCNDKLEIFDANDNLIYEIRTHCCQIGLCSGRNAETVAKIDFKIFPPDSDNIIGHLIKIPSLNDKLGRMMVDSHQNFHDSSNSFIVNFPDGASPEDKFLLIIASIKLGYQFFTQNRGSCSCYSCCGSACNYCCIPCRFTCGACACPFCLFC